MAVFFPFPQVFSVAASLAAPPTRVSMAATARWTCGCGGDASPADYGDAKKSAWKRNVSTSDLDFDSDLDMDPDLTLTLLYIDYDHDIALDFDFDPEPDLNFVSNFD